MLIVERQQKLLEMIRQRQSCDLASLAADCGVSVATVRRDVESLRQQGLVETPRGGVVFRGRAAPPSALEERMNEQVAAKLAIGKTAAGLIQPGMTVFLDGGSTMHYMAVQIAVRPLQVVTNSLTIATQFANDERVELIMLGGTLYPRTGVMVGPLTMQSLAEIHADLMLFSGAGIFGNDVFNSNMAMVQVEKLAVAQAAKRILLADSSKFGRKGLARVCAWTDLDLIITDADIAADWSSLLADRIRIAPA
ncbi:MAG: DeoR/GlpR transcriptional regulator [Phycisphaerae bacterium]|nr:DeoR/GlpR transcriptional regulator [Phycisphaerae bacterium]